MAVFTEPTLQAWDLPYEILQSDEDLEMINKAFEKAQATSKPAAVLITETTV